jgi:hypothetical protein
MNMNTTGNLHEAVNDLRVKARRAFYAIKIELKLDIPIKIWLQVFDAVIPLCSTAVRSGVHSLTKTLLNRTNIKPKLYMQNAADRS